MYRFGIVTGIENMKSICISCGSRIGNNPAYSAAAREIGQALAALPTSNSFMAADGSDSWAF